MRAFKNVVNYNTADEGSMSQDVDRKVAEQQISSHAEKDPRKHVNEAVYCSPTSVFQRNVGLNTIYLTLKVSFLFELLLYFLDNPSFE